MCSSMCMYACTSHAYVSVCAGVRVHVQYLTEIISNLYFIISFYSFLDTLLILLIVTFV